MGKLNRKIKRREALYRGLLAAGAMSPTEAEVLVDAVEPLPEPAKTYPSPNRRGGRAAAKDKRKRRAKR